MSLRFYFPSQMNSEGSTVQYDEMSPSAYAGLYWDLANAKEQGDLDVRLLKDGKVVSKQ